MDSAELRIYTALTHPVVPEPYRLSEDGTKLYVVEHGILVTLYGEGLDKMTGMELYHWHLPIIRDLKLKGYL